MPASLRDKQKTRDIVLRIIEAKCRGLALGKNWTGTCEMKVYANWTHKNGKRRRRDVHNYCVVLIDLLQAPLMFDDSQIRTFIMHKRQAAGREHVIVSFSR